MTNSEIRNEISDEFQTKKTENYLGASFGGKSTSKDLKLTEVQVIKDTPYKRA